MRKIRASMSLHEQTFKPILQIILKDEDNFVTVLYKEELKPESLFYVNKNAFCNNLLVAKGFAKLTQEEIEWIEDRDNKNTLPMSEPTIDELKNLSGI